MAACELCDLPAQIFCPSDQAWLCCACDHTVHSANFLVARHPRSSLCPSCSRLQLPGGDVPCRSCMADEPSNLGPEEESDDAEVVFEDDFSAAESEVQDEHDDCSSITDHAESSGDACCSFGTGMASAFHRCSYSEGMHVQMHTPLTYGGGIEAGVFSDSEDCSSEVEDCASMVRSAWKATSRERQCL